jgi:hypothetical protein
VELWIDGVQTVKYTGRPIAFGSAGAYDIVRMYAQYGQGDRYIDDFAVGDTRIGCSASPPSTPTASPAPSPPTGLISK